MVDPVIVRKIDRAQTEVVDGLGVAGVATVAEAAGGVGLLDPRIRPIQVGQRIAGSAVTVVCAPGDNIMVHAALEVIEPGDILVVTTSSPSDHGMFGELLGVSATARGCRGLVIDGAVRDVAELREMGFPAWARAIHARGTTKDKPGAVNVKIRCGGVEINPGDVVVADDDGVVAVAMERTEEVLEAARLRWQREAETRRRLESGELGLDMYGFRERLVEMGMRWIDSPED